MNDPTEKGSSTVTSIVIIVAILVAGFLFFGSNQIRTWWNGEAMPAPPVITDTGNEVPLIQQYKDLVRVTVPEQDTVVPNPLVLKGEARGMWFFEASFPVRLIDANGEDVALEPGYVTATTDWMTESYVPFSGTFSYVTPETNTGTLILLRDNPSGLPENEDAFMIPIRFR